MDIVLRAVAVFAFLLVLTRVMAFDDFQWLWGAALGAVAISLSVTVGLGLLGTWRVLGQKPASHLRTL